MLSIAKAVFIPNLIFSCIVKKIFFQKKVASRCQKNVLVKLNAVSRDLLT